MSCYLPPGTNHCIFSQKPQSRCQRHKNLHPRVSHSWNVITEQGFPSLTLYSHRSGLVPTLGRQSPLQTVVQGCPHASVFWLGGISVKKHMERTKITMGWNTIWGNKLPMCLRISSYKKGARQGIFIYKCFLYSCVLTNAIRYKAQCSLSRLLFSFYR